MLANYFDYLPTLKILSHRPHSVIGPWQLFKISDPSALSPPYGSQHNNQHLVPLGSKQTHSSICALDIHCRHKIRFWFSCCGFRLSSSLFMKKISGRSRRGIGKLRLMADFIHCVCICAFNGLIFINGMKWKNRKTEKFGCLGNTDSEVDVWDRCTESCHDYDIFSLIFIVYGKRHLTQSFTNLPLDYHTIIPISGWSSCLLNPLISPSLNQNAKNSIQR